MKNKNTIEPLRRRCATEGCVGRVITHHKFCNKCWRNKKDFNLYKKDKIDLGLRRKIYKHKPLGNNVKDGNKKLH